MGNSCLSAAVLGGESEEHQRAVYLYGTYVGQAFQLVDDALDFEGSAQTIGCCAVLLSTMLCCAVLYYSPLCCAVLCCTTLPCAVLCCVVLLSPVLCCAVLHYSPLCFSAVHSIDFKSSPYTPYPPTHTYQAKPPWQTLSQDSPLHPPYSPLTSSLSSLHSLAVSSTHQVS